MRIITITSLALALALGACNSKDDKAPPTPIDDVGPPPVLTPAPVEEKAGEE